MVKLVIREKSLIQLAKLLEMVLLVWSSKLNWFKEIYLVQQMIKLLLRRFYRIRGSRWVAMHIYSFIITVLLLADLVSFFSLASFVLFIHRNLLDHFHNLIESRTSNHENGHSSKCCKLECLFLFKWRKGVSTISQFQTITPRTLPFPLSLPSPPPPIQYILYIQYKMLCRNSQMVVKGEKEHTLNAMFRAPVLPLPLPPHLIRLLYVAFR